MITTKRCIFAVLFILGVAATTFCAAESRMITSTPSMSERNADGLLVKFKAHVNEQQMHSISEKYGALEIRLLASPKQVTSGSPMAQWQHLKFSSDSDLQHIMQIMAQDADIETVELNSRVTIQK